jgi:polyhydroxyalkanoate synthesis regulator protein
MKNTKPAFEEYRAAHTEREAIRNDLVERLVLYQGVEVKVVFPTHLRMSMQTVDRFELWLRDKLTQAMTDVLTAVDAREERAFAALQEAIAKDAEERAS